MPWPAPGKCRIIPERWLLLSLPERAGGPSHHLAACSRDRRHSLGTLRLAAQSVHLPAAKGLLTASNTARQEPLSKPTLAGSDPTLPGLGLQHEICF